MRSVSLNRYVSCVPPVWYWLSRCRRCDRIGILVKDKSICVQDTPMPFAPDALANELEGYVAACFERSLRAQGKYVDSKVASFGDSRFPLSGTAENEMSDRAVSVLSIPSCVEKASWSRPVKLRSIVA